MKGHTPYRGPVWILLVCVLPVSILAGLSCLSNPCIHGVCIDDLNSTYSCYCINGYTGIQCQTNWDECWSSPCKNGGTCIDGIAEYNCTCPDGFIGLNCEEDFDECDSNPCQNNGTCIDGANGYECLCLPGYLGTHCEHDVAVCNITEETRCDNGGKCVEGKGMSFFCKCTPGWGGKLCNVPINECDSSPCENGALCVDLHADFLCACPFGYTGKQCESPIQLCSNNPCTNDALCMMEDEIWVCYCVPDFHGDKCEYQYDECLLGPKCKNGGTCIDGVDNFTCSCPPMLTGVLCECLILEDNKLDCTYISPSTETPFITMASTTTYAEKPTSTTIYQEMTVENREEDITTSRDAGTSEGDVTVTIVPTYSWEQSTFTDLDNRNFTLRQTTLSYTDMTTVDNTTPTEIYNRETTAPTTDTEQTTKDFTTTRSSDQQTFTSDKSVTLRNITAEYSTTSPTFSYTTDLTKDDAAFSIPFAFTTAYDSTTQPVTITELVTVDSTLKTDSVNELTSESSLTFTESSTGPSTESEIVTKIGVIDSGDSKKDEVTTLIESELQTVVTTEAISTTEEVIPETTKDEKMSTTTEKAVFFTEAPIETTDVELTTQFEKELTTKPTEIGECVNLTCLNGGSCILSTEGPKCVCKFDYDGELCENSVGIASAAFSGDSYLTHRLNNLTGMKIEVRARTLSSDILILYANIGSDNYMSVYTENGLMKFKFSCGYQTMLLSELEMPINTGYEMRIKAILEFTDKRKHCNASLHINDTLAMSGGQVAVPTSYPPDRSSWLHLGAVAEGFGATNHSPQEISPFTGCMMGLKIDGIPRHIFKDASDGFEIKECTSLACLSNPCKNGGTCSEEGDQWKCSCSNGFLGNDCHQSVCDVNPCQFGGTCVKHPGSGYVCLCPLGKHGLYCEHNLEVAQPLFSPMLEGLSSFAAYPLPSQLITYGMEMHFKIKPQNMDQIALLAFLGQTGHHDSKSDHIAVTFVKGYIMLTWNLGNGPRRIFTSRPITPRGNRPHTIRMGRLGRTAWLAVDNMPNITGNAPGNLQQMNVLPLLYLGGHESRNFSTLPHDLPLHDGFSGCIWDLWLRGGGGNGNGNSGSMVWNPSRGRAVGQCGVTQCHALACHNGGACLHHAATYSCICSEGWFGPVCNSPKNPCNSEVHNCTKESVCVPTINGYECDCPLGKRGEHCEMDIELSDVSLSGIRSYLLLNAVQIGDVHFSLDFEVRPMHPKGLIFFTETHDGGFVSISIQGGLLEYRWAGLEWGGRIEGRIVTVVRSGVIISLGSWHSVRIGRYGRRLFLWVDGTMTTETLSSHHFFTPFNTSISIGGAKDLSALPDDVMAGPVKSFTGCVRKFVINSQRYPLNKKYIIESRNIDDCDGDVCGGDLCWNGGTCMMAQSQGQTIAQCVCAPLYTGQHCTEQLPCSEGGCNTGRCENGKCVCPTGWGGQSCQDKVKMGAPHFRGNSFLVIDEKKIQYKKTNLPKYRARRSVDNIYVNFTTVQPNGVLLWTEIDNHKYISIGVDGGYLKLSWLFISQPNVKKSANLLAVEETKMWPRQKLNDSIVIKVLQAGKVANGEWHTINLMVLTGNITLLLDNKKVYEETGGVYEVRNTDITVFLGGFPSNVSTSQQTDGLYSSNFIGCVSELSFEPEKYPITNFSPFQSENVESCSLLV